MVRLLTKEDVAKLLNMPDALEYVEEAYKQLTLGNAFAWGSWMAVKRVLRCHPFHPGGFDPVK